MYITYLFVILFFKLIEEVIDDLVNFYGCKINHKIISETLKETLNLSCIGLNIICQMKGVMVFNATFNNISVICNSVK